MQIATRMAMSMSRPCILFTTKTSLTKNEYRYRVMNFEKQLLDRNRKYMADAPPMNLGIYLIISTLSEKNVLSIKKKRIIYNFIEFSLIIFIFYSNKLVIVT